MSPRWWLVMLLAAADGGFGDAQATIVDAGPERVSLILEVNHADASSVVAHLLEPGGVEQVVAMAPMGGGRFVATVEIRRVDYVVVFEELTNGYQSDPLRLTAIGADPEVLAGQRGSVQVPSTPREGTNRNLLIVGVIAGVGSLVLLSLVPFLGRAKPSAEEDESVLDPNRPE